jgi:hypothetical protein
VASSIIPSPGNVVYVPIGSTLLITKSFKTKSSFPGPKAKTSGTKPIIFIVGPEVPCVPCVP